MLSTYSIRKLVNLLSLGGGSTAGENTASSAVNHVGHILGTEEFALVSDSRPCLGLSGRSGSAALTTHVCFL